MYEQYLSFSIELAKEAGNFLLPHAGKAGQQTVKSPKDFVTEMDLAVEELIIRRIQEQYPEHRIFSEEAGVVEAESDFEWVIDPIDGTINYSVGVPLYGVCIALTYQGEPIVASISLPGLGETFWAVKGAGAFLNGERIQVRQATLSEAFVSVNDFAKDGKKETNQKRLALLEAIVDEVYRVRIIGTAAVTLSYIAAGRWDGAIYDGPNWYDVAAGQLIVEEAGGVVKRIGEYLVFGVEEVVEGLVGLQGVKTSLFY